MLCEDMSHHWADTRRVYVCNNKRLCVDMSYHWEDHAVGAIVLIVFQRPNQLEAFDVG